MQPLTLLIAAALALVSAFALPTPASASPLRQERASPPIPGVYTTDWGRAVLTVAADGRTGEFRFDDGTRIVGSFISGGSQFVGDYVRFVLPARGYYEPPRCDATVPPRAFLSGRSSSRWWGSIYISFTPDERIRGYVNPCRSLPHDRATQVLRLTSVLVERTPPLRVGRAATRRRGDQAVCCLRKH